MSSNERPSDRDASELVSRSYDGSLQPDEQLQLEATLAERSELRAFHDLSSMIQESVAEVAARSLAGDTSIAPGMSAASKRRMQDSILEAQRESISLANVQSVDIGPAGGDSSSVSYGLNAGDIRTSASSFRLIRPIAKGGLGSVWLAYDEDLKRKIAIKSISAKSMASPKAWQRFHREAEVTGQLEHPNVVPLYQYGLDSDTGEPFYSMRFLGKRTLANAIHEYHALKKTCDADDLGMHRMLTVFLDVCQAIAYAHSRRIIHRDLKPENVALDSFGQVIVLDWGLAKFLDDVDIVDTRSELQGEFDDEVASRTMAGDIVGTPLYMSPEQASGAHDQVDERTDVYGLGAVLFSILTGSAPHRRTVSDSGSFSMEQLLESISAQETPKARDLCECAPRELERICLKAMSKQPFARYQSASELAQAVERWMAGQSDKNDSVRKPANGRARIAIQLHGFGQYPGGQRAIRGVLAADF